MYVSQCYELLTISSKVLNIMNNSDMIYRRQLTATDVSLCFMSPTDAKVI